MPGTNDSDRPILMPVSAGSQCTQTSAVGSHRRMEHGGAASSTAAGSVLQKIVPSLLRGEGCSGKLRASVVGAARGEVQ